MLLFPFQTRTSNRYIIFLPPQVYLSSPLSARSSPVSHFGNRWRAGRLSGWRSPDARTTSCAFRASAVAGRSGASPGPCGWSTFISDDHPIRSQQPPGPGRRWTLAPGAWISGSSAFFATTWISKSVVYIILLQALPSFSWTAVVPSVDGKSCCCFVVMLFVFFCIFWGGVDSVAHCRAHWHLSCISSFFLDKSHLSIP